MIKADDASNGTNQHHVKNAIYFNIPNKMQDLNPKENFRQAQTEEQTKKFKNILKKFEVYKGKERRKNYSRLKATKEIQLNVTLKLRFWIRIFFFFFCYRGHYVHNWQNLNEICWSDNSIKSPYFAGFDKYTAIIQKKVLVFTKYTLKYLEAMGFTSVIYSLKVKKN